MTADFYHRKVTAKEILAGSVARPIEAADLYRALDMHAGTQSTVLTSPPAYTAASQSAPPAIPSRDKTAEIRAVALYDYEGQRADDLSFKRGDTLVILKQTASQNDWWIGRKASSQDKTSGNFPANVSALVCD
jgi:hypothetical protein